MCESGAPRNRRVLVIDDNRDVADSLCMLLECFGAAAHAAYSGREGIEAFSRMKPDITIIELSLSDMSGLDVARQIRPWLENGAQLVATDGGHWHKRNSLDSLFDRLLLKPINAEALEELLACPPRVDAIR